MGGKASKSSLLEKYGTLLSSQEKIFINDSFEAITNSQETEHFNEQQLQAYLQKVGVSGINVQKLFIALSVSRQHDGKSTLSLCQVTYPSFIENVSWIAKGSAEKRAQVIMSILGEPSLVQGLDVTIENYLKVLLMSKQSSIQLPQLHEWPTGPDSLSILVSYLTESLKHLTESDSSQHYLTIHDIESWLMTTPLANCIFQSVFTLCFLIPSTKVEDFDGLSDSETLLLPSKIIHPLVKETFVSLLLDQVAIMFLNSVFPYDVRGMVYPLFSSQLHGESFSTLCRQILNRGPTLIVVRDKQGYVFGGFAGNSWKFHPQFQGCGTSFLFTLRPSFGVYIPTGYNDNYMYLQQSAQTLPNGLGMGGQLNYFGLWLSAEYGRGHSRARPKCSTFGSPCLSSTEEFEIDVLEAWGIGRPHLPDDDDDDDEDQVTSILDKDKEAQAILEIAGKSRHSKGLREEHDDN